MRPRQALALAALALALRPAGGSLDPAAPHLQLRPLPPARHAAPGSPLRLTCAVSELRPAVPPERPLRKLKASWLKNDAPLNRKAYPQPKKFVGNGTVFFTLEITNITANDKAYYTCVVLDGVQELKSTCIVNVTDEVIAEGRNVPFDVLSPVSEVNFTSAFPTKLLDPATSPVFEFTIPDNPSTVAKTTSDYPLPTQLSTNEYEKPSERNSSVFNSLALCQIYNGAICAKFLKDQYVYIPYPITQSALEERLTIAFGVVSFSNEISTNCEKYALPSLCFSTFPVCRTPEETNENFSLYLKETRESELNILRKPSAKRKPDREKDSELAVSFENLPSSFRPSDFGTGQLAQSDFIKLIDERNKVKKRTNRDIEYRIDTITKTIAQEPDLKFDRHTKAKEKKFSISRDTVSLRRVCRDDCEILENELCQEEYAIAKRHPEIGQKLTLEDCVDLPADSLDCLEIGIEKFIGSKDECYWETGHDYRGVENRAKSGHQCMKWSHQLKVKISNHPELSGGHSYCRNPGGFEDQPWCFVEIGTKTERHLCEIPKCSQKIWIYIIVTITILVAILLTCIFICFHYQNSKNNTTAIRNINLPNAGKNIYGNSRLNSPIELSDMPNCQGGSGNPSSSRTNKIITVPQYNLSQIKFLEELGEGAFGKVYKGKLTRENDTILVAVKALKENASHKTQLDFKREIELISELNHDNIVCILGVVLREEPLCMLFEFMALGDLHEYLVSKAPPNGACLVAAQLLSISHHIAAGMEYLAAHHYVHRDLAARNCLVAENLVVKISDFGLSRDIYSSDYYRVQSKSLLPIRWMPPESILYGKFTSESDVWSYGVVLWEIYSYGLQPYYGYSNQEVISMVRGRELLKPPSDCPRAIYNLMKECWNQTPARRPNFTAISLRLNEWINSTIGFHADNSSESSGAHSGQRAAISGGDPRERVPLISHHSSSNGSLSGSIPRKLSTAGSIRSHASTRLMVSSSDVTSGSDNCDGLHHKKLSCGSLLEGQPSSSHGDRHRDGKTSAMSQPYAI